MLSRTTEAAAASPCTPAGLGAQSLLAQGLSSQVSNQVEKLAGISYLSLNPVLGGNGQKPGAQLALQQRVTKNLLFTFGTDVTSTQGQDDPGGISIQPEVVGKSGPGPAWRCCRGRQNA